MRRLYALLLCIVIFVAAKSQTLTVNAPSHVTTGENFRLTYTTNTQNVGDLSLGNLPEDSNLLQDLISRHSRVSRW